MVTVSNAVRRLKATAAARPKKPAVKFKPGSVVMIKFIDTMRGKSRMTVETPLYFDEKKQQWGYGLRPFTDDGKLPKSWDKVYFGPADEITPAKN